MATIIETTDAPDSGTTTPYNITPFNVLEIDAPEGDTFLGSLGTGLSTDSDVIATDLLAGTEYSLDLVASTPIFAGEFVVQIFDADNNLLATGAETFTALISGTFFITISTSSGSDASAGDYALSVQTVSLPAPTGPTEGDDVLAGTEERDVIDLLAGNDIYDALGGDDDVSGGAGNDTINGGDGDDLIRGETGNDTIDGGAGDDFITGSSGEDVIKGGKDNDTINGGGSNDTLQGNAGNDLLLGKNGDDVMIGGEGNDILRGGRGDDRIIGGEGDDRLTGANGADTLEGRDGNDFLHGGDDNDVLIGGEGDDHLRGDKGDDTLIMDAGNDILSGEEGADTFIFNTSSPSLIIDGPILLDDEIWVPTESETTPWTATVTDFTIFEDDLLIDGLTFIEAAFAGLLNPELSSFDEIGATLVLNSGDTIVFEGITEEMFIGYLESLDIGIIPIEPPMDVF